jgi:oxygen-independent coproporphyrinogen-3 oxidase
VIYIHVPFCRSFCTYCDFYSELAPRCRRDEDLRAQVGLFARYADAVCAEVGVRRGDVSSEVNTLYIGGGTPSVLPLSVLSRVVGSVSGFGPFDEFTVEVNPEDVVERGLEYAVGLRGLGVNRVSMGVQSFDDSVLRWMNRRHSAAGAVEAFGILRAAGFSNISVDLIFGLSQLSSGQWRDTVARAIGLGAEHVSAYQLSVESGSALGKLVARGRYVEASDEVCAGQYGVLCDMLAEAGYGHYEVSNFARPGFEARHNGAYWRRVPYVGLGPGAHSLRGNVRSWNGDSLDGYLKRWSGAPSGAVSEASSGTFSETSSVAPSGDSDGFEVLSEAQVVEETIMLGLRTAEGVDRGYLLGHCPASVIDRLFDSGSLEISGDRIRIPESRFFVSDDIISDLI